MITPRSWLLKLFAPLVALVVLAACTTDDGDSGEVAGDSEGAASGDPAEPGDHVVRIGVESEPTTLDPHVRASVNFPIIGNVYESLVERTADGEFVPWLATGWEIAADGESVRLQLRDDVRFHSGDPFAAEAVVATFEKGADPETSGVLGVHLIHFDEVVVHDDYDVEIKFSQGHAEERILDILEFAQIIDPSTIDVLDEEAGGSGPFKVASVDPGVGFRLVRNEDYWGEPALPAELDFVVFGDEEARFAALQSGDIDVAELIGLDVARRVQEPLQLIEPPVSCVSQVLMNTREGRPFADRTVRQAIQLAVDRESIAQQINGTEPRVLPWDEETVAYDPAALDSHGYDPGRAGQLLEQAGAVDGEAELLLIAGFSDLTQMGQVIQADLDDLGFNLRLSILPRRELGPRVFGGDFDAFVNFSCNMERYPTTAAGDTLYQVDGNFAFDGDSDIAERWAEARAMADGALDDAAQQQAAELMNEVLLDEAWVVHVARRPWIHALSERITGFGMNSWYPLYANVELES